jgi:N-acetylmuramoyl-L-alanine amidase
MTSGGPISTQRARLRALAAIVIAAAMALCATFPARADNRKAASDQFARAVKMRTMLEGYLEKDRSLDDYKETVGAYHKVYLITPFADESTAALVAEAELYAEMGRLYDAKYYQSSISSYKFLLTQYPGSRYRADALLAIAQIQRDDLTTPQDARATYEEYLKRFPHSEKSAEARADLKEIENGGKPAYGPKTKNASTAAASANTPANTSGNIAGYTQGNTESMTPTGAGGATKSGTGSAIKRAAVSNATVSEAALDAASDAGSLPEMKGDRVEPRTVDSGNPAVTGVQAWNAQNATRIVVAVADTVKFKAMRIASPDRIFFDLYNARVTSKVSSNTLDFQSGLLKSVRVAQNKPNVVRVVLDVNGAKDYSAYLLAKPYRLVIEVRSQAAASVAKNIVPTVPSSAPASMPAPTAAMDSSASAESTTPKTHANVHETVVEKVEVDDRDRDTELPVAATRIPAKTVSLPREKNPTREAALEPAPEPRPTRDGERSLTRVLGLKISRIVIDAGHGGHDTGTIGPHGLMEKDVCLDVALRLGRLIQQKLPGAQVIYTRSDDTFVPLEERTAIANQAKADLFISIHANSSGDPDARGIETFYLNFATSRESMEVASRENANAQESLHDLQDLIKKIARNDKIEESKELAGDIDDTLSQRLQLVSRDERNRGVKKAPFVVLIGANMPSVLAEISFLSNPSDERLMRKPEQRQRIADGLYRGINNYLESLNSISNNQQKVAVEVGDGHLEAGGVASSGNPK